MKISIKTEITEAILMRIRIASQARNDILGTRTTLFRFACGRLRTQYCHLCLFDAFIGLYQ